MTATKSIPQTPGRPGVGDALDFLFNPVNYFVDAAAEHGPVFRADVMGKPMYFVVGTRGRGLFAADAPGGCPLTRQGMFPVFKQETFVDVFGLDGEAHQAVRGLLQLGFSRLVAAQFVAEMVEGTRRVVRTWRPQSKIPMLRTAGELATRCIMTSLTPIDLEPLLGAAALAGNVVMNVVMGVAPQSTLKLPAYVRGKERMIEGLDRAVARHRAGLFADDRRTFMIDAFLQARGPGDIALDDVGVRGAALYSLAGTYVYLSRTISLVLYHLLRDRALLGRVQDEVDTVMAGGPPSARDLRRLPLMRACIRESLRLYPPVPAISMTTTRELQVEGYTVPAGAAIAFSSIPDHYNPDFFDHPFEFDPERWFSERRRPRPRGSYGAFGIGTQTCAASGMVEVIVMATLVGVLYEARLRLVRASYRPRMMLNPLLGPVGGMPLVFEGLRGDGSRHVRPDALVNVEFESWTDEDSLDPDDLDISAIECTQGDRIVVQGDEPDAFYVIVDGLAEVLVEADGRVQRVAELGAGQSFGEIGLFKSIPRTATVRATTRMTMMRLDRLSFETLAAGTDLTGPELGSLLYRRYIDKALGRSLPGLAKQLRKGGLQDFEVVAAQPGDVIIRQGESADAFYVLAVGEADVMVVDRHGELKVVAQLQAGAGFGEMGLLENRPRSATIQITGSQPALLLRMNREHFLELMRESPDALADLSCLMRRRLMDNLDAVYEG